VNEWWDRKSLAQRALIIIGCLIVPIAVFSTAESASQDSDATATTLRTGEGRTNSTQAEPLATTSQPPTTFAEPPPTEAQTAETAASDNAASKNEWTDSDVEYQLAVIDSGGFVPFDDPSIDAYRLVLDRLEPKCSEARRLIADQAVRAVQLLADEGVQSNAFEMMEAADVAISSDLGQVECAGIFAALITLMIG